jgi:hypothetical protein
MILELFKILDQVVDLSSVEELPNDLRRLRVVNGVQILLQVLSTTRCHTIKSLGFPFSTFG